MQDKLPGKDVSSAGLKAMLGKPIALSASALLSEHGYNTDGHKAKQLTADIVADADLVLVMERSHKIMLMEKYPSLSGKVMMLGYWSNMEIEDPYHKSNEAFRHVYEQIEKCCLSWSLKIDSPL